MRSQCTMGPQRTQQTNNKTGFKRLVLSIIFESLTFNWSLIQSLKLTVMMKLKETNVCTYLMETKVVLYFLLSPLALVLTTLFIMVENSDECYQPNICRCWNIFIPEYMEALQQSREVKVTYVEDPIKVTSGNLRNQDTFVVDSSI